MDIQKMLAELRETRRQIDEAIISLDRISRGRGKPLERPTSSITTKAVNNAKRAGRRAGSKNKAKFEAARIESIAPATWPNKTAVLSSVDPLYDQI